MSKLLYDHGIAIMRCQPLHNGHKSLLEKMFHECMNSTVLIGSIQEHDTDRNPFNGNERRQMVENVRMIINKGRVPIPSKLRIVGLADIDEPEEWARYVLDIVQDVCHIPVDAYYCGSKYDGYWFDCAGLKVVIQERSKNPATSGTAIREMLKYGGDWKRLIDPVNYHIMERIITKFEEQKQNPYKTRMEEV